MHHRRIGIAALLNLQEEQAVQALYDSPDPRRVAAVSSYDCSDGGTPAVAWPNVVYQVRMGIWGAMVQLSVDGLRRDAVLFGESQSRIVLSVKSEQAETVLNQIWDAGVPAAENRHRGRQSICAPTWRVINAQGCTIDRIL